MESVQAVRSSRIVTRSGVQAGIVLISGSKILGIAPFGESFDSLRVTDVGDHMILPGLVDCHVHLNEPGRTEWEGFETGTRAAAAGGVTTLIDMPLNCLPVTTTRSALEQKIAACAGQCFVDVGFWGGVVPGNQADLVGLRDAGALGCKAFMVHSGIDEFPNATEADLR